jgi:hypothetical protein
LLYHNLKTGITIFPSLRAAPETQQTELINTFWTFFSDAGLSLRLPGVQEFSVVKDRYRFYAMYIVL